MMKIEQLGNVSITEVLDLKVIERAIQTAVMKGNEVASIKEVSAWRDELLETTYEAVLEDIINNVFDDIEEGTDELLEALENELEDYLQKLVHDELNSQKQLH